MSDLTLLPNRLDSVARTCRAVVETTFGSRAKIDFDPESGLFLLAGVLPAGMAFPLDFGFIPSTLGEDGDPLDVLILAECDLPVGCLADVQLIGVIEANQTEDDGHGGCSTVRNDRLVARLAHSRSFADVEEIAQLGDGFRAELERFFVTYNALKGKRFEVIATRDAAAAVGAVEKAQRPR